MNSHILEGIRFVTVGIIAVLIDFVVYFLLLHFTSISPSLSKAFSFVSGSLFSFVGHRLFVFKARETAAQKQVFPFTLLYSSSLLINNLINQVILNITRISLLAWFLATAVSVAWNYVGMKFVVFKKKSDTIIS